METQVHKVFPEKDPPTGRWARLRAEGSFLKRNAVSIFISDMAGLVLSLGGLWAAYKFAPQTMDRLESWIGKKLEPYYEWLKPLVDKTGIELGDSPPVIPESPEEKKYEALGKPKSAFEAVAPREELTREEGSKLIAKKLVIDLLLAGGVGAGIAYGLHCKFDKDLGVQNRGWDLFFSQIADNGVQLGSTVVISTALGKQTERAKNAISSVLQGVGVSKEKADRYVNYSLRIELPNFIGMVGKLSYVHFFGKQEPAPAR